MGLVPRSYDVPIDAYHDFDLRQMQFFAWMDAQLQKIESFYRLKEDEANQRLRVLKEQLREMNDRRIREALLARRASRKAKLHDQNAQPRPPDQVHQTEYNRQSLTWLGPIGRVWSQIRLDSSRKSRKMSLTDEDAWSTSRHLPPSQSERQVRTDNRRDFERRKDSSDSVPHRQAKRKLKAALCEYYRGMELLKSYALLNRTAFRKMNKKYDKIVQAYPGGRYFAEKVNTAWFVQSAVLDSNMRQVEELYAKYFEKDNHKVAVGKLRTKTGRQKVYHGSVYRNGLLAGAGVVFGTQGLVAGAKLLFDSDPTIRLRTAYLLQVCCHNI